MSRKIKRTPQAALSIKGAFDEFVVAQTAKGFSESTIKNYHSHFHSISKHFDIEKSFGELTQTDIDGMIVSMRESGLATNSISSYLRVFKTFMNWSQQQGYLGRLYAAKHGGPHDFGQNCLPFDVLLFCYDRTVFLFLAWRKTDVH